jgi:hypothetical protein
MLLAAHYAPVFVIALAGLLWLRRPDDKWLHLLVLAGLWIPLVAAMTGGLMGIGHLTSVRYDDWFLAIDARFGYPSFAAGRLLASTPWLKWVASWNYVLFIPIGFAAVTANLAAGRIRSGYEAFIAMLLSAVLAVPFYMFLPASGPAYVFSGWPLVLPPNGLHIIFSSAPPNCFPSNHMSIAILATLAVWRWRVGRILGCTHIPLTIIGTLGLGEHYTIDLIAAVPYAVCIFWVASKVVVWLPIQDAGQPHESFARAGGASDSALAHTGAVEAEVG